MKIRNDAEVRLKVTADASDSKKSVDSLNNKAKETPKHFDTIKNVGAKAFKATAVAITATATALGGLTAKAVKSYADLEQNIGGIETLFGAGGAKSVEEYAKNVEKSVDQVKGEYEKLKASEDYMLQKAKEGYKTAGLSANEYMQTVTSFSASLLQSVGGDTMKAAKAADAALIDMSDNANKMGTSMELIQNAYQGFAKQNYTMLDNLKLGYGGTKTEMERLLKDAQKISGVKYNIDNLNDVYSAIHVIQEKMKIAGTTAKEAEGTISGSINMTKAAFDNFLNGSGSVDDLIYSIDKVIENVAPAVQKLAPQIITGLIDVVNHLIPEIPKLLKQLLPALINGAINLINGLISAIPQLISVLAQMLPQITTSLLQGLTEIIDRLAKMIPVLIPQITNAIIGVVNQLTNMMPTLIPQIINAILDIIPVLLENLPLLIQAGIQLLMGIVQGLVKAIPLLVAKLPLIIQSIINTLIGLLPQLILMAPQIIMAIITGLIESIPLLIEMAPQIIMGLINGLFKGLEQFVMIGGKIISSMWNGIKKAIPSLLSKIPGIPKQTLEKLNAGFAAVDNIGKNIMKGLWNGIQGMKTWVINKVKDIGKSILKGLKGILGIHSPSKEFAIIGKYSIMGYEEGLEDMQRSLDKTLEDTMGLDFLKNGSVSVSSNYGSISTPNVQNQNVINVEANMDVNKFGQVFVNDIKTFSGGSKQSYNY